MVLPPIYHLLLSIYLTLISYKYYMYKGNQGKHTSFETQQDRLTSI